MKKVKGILSEFIYIFLNYFVCNIPCWYIRKIFYKLFGMKIGKNSRILMKVKIVAPWQISIGNNTIINEYCFLDGRGYLDIKDNVSISIYTLILTAQHDSKSNKFEYTTSKVTIENNVWIGARSIILPGSYLKHAVLIGAGSTVKRGIYEDNCFYSGVPAKYISSRYLEDDYELGSWKPYFR